MLDKDMERKGVKRKRDVSAKSDLKYDEDEIAKIDDRLKPKGRLLFERINMAIGLSTSFQMLVPLIEIVVSYYTPRQRWWFCSYNVSESKLHCYDPEITTFVHDQEIVGDPCKKSFRLSIYSVLGYSELTRQMYLLNPIGNYLCDVFCTDYMDANGQITLVGNPCPHFWRGIGVVPFSYSNSCVWTPRLLYNDHTCFDLLTETQKVLSTYADFSSGRIASVAIDERSFIAFKVTSDYITQGYYFQVSEESQKPSTHLIPVESMCCPKIDLGHYGPARGFTIQIIDNQIISTTVVGTDFIHVSSLKFVKSAKGITFDPNWNCLVHYAESPPIPGPRSLRYQLKYQLLTNGKLISYHNLLKEYFELDLLLVIRQTPKDSQPSTQPSSHTASDLSSRKHILHWKNIQLPNVFPTSTSYCSDFIVINDLY